MDHMYSKRGAEEVHMESGIVPRCINHLFDYIKENPNKAQFRITVSFLEIYMEQITDLLMQPANGQSQSNFNISQTPNHKQAASHSPIRQSMSSSSSLLGQDKPGQNLKLREDPKTGIFVDGLTQINVKSKDQLH
jgi:Kinesin motor domain